MRVREFCIFYAAITLIPFIFKKNVFDAAMTSALLCSCESWLTNKAKSLETVQQSSKMFIRSEKKYEDRFTYG